MELSNLLLQKINCIYLSVYLTNAGYFVPPNDVISEEIYGPLGYIDDIFLCTVVLKKFKKNVVLIYLINSEAMMKT